MTPAQEALQTADSRNGPKPSAAEPDASVSAATATDASGSPNKHAQTSTRGKIPSINTAVQEGHMLCLYLEHVYIRAHISPCLQDFSILSAKFLHPVSALFSNDQVFCKQTAVQHADMSLPLTYFPKFQKSNLFAAGI